MADDLIIQAKMRVNDILFAEDAISKINRPFDQLSTHAQRATNDLNTLARVTLKLKENLENAGNVQLGKNIDSLASNFRGLDSTLVKLAGEAKLLGQNLVKAGEFDTHNLEKKFNEFITNLKNSAEKANISESLIESLQKNFYAGIRNMTQEAVKQIESINKVVEKQNKEIAQRLRLPAPANVASAGEFSDSRANPNTRIQQLREEGRLRRELIGLAREHGLADVVRTQQRGRGRITDLIRGGNISDANLVDSRQDSTDIARAIGVLRNRAGKKGSLGVAVLQKEVDLLQRIENRLTTEISKLSDSGTQADLDGKLAQISTLKANIKKTKDKQVKDDLRQELENVQRDAAQLQRSQGLLKNLGTQKEGIVKQKSFLETDIATARSFGFGFAPDIIDQSKERQSTIRRAFTGKTDEISSSKLRFRTAFASNLGNEAEAAEKASTRSTTTVADAQRARVDERATRAVKERIGLISQEIAAYERLYAELVKAGASQKDLDFVQGRIGGRQDVLNKLSGVKNPNDPLLRSEAGFSKANIPIIERAGITKTSEDVISRITREAGQEGFTAEGDLAIRKSIERNRQKRAKQEELINKAERAKRARLEDQKLTDHTDSVNEKRASLDEFTGNQTGFTAEGDITLRKEKEKRDRREAGQKEAIFRAEQAARKREQDAKSIGRQNDIDQKRGALDEFAGDQSGFTAAGDIAIRKSEDRKLKKLLRDQELFIKSGRKESEKQREDEDNTRISGRRATFEDFLSKEGVGPVQEFRKGVAIQKLNDSSEALRFKLSNDERQRAIQLEKQIVIEQNREKTTVEQLLRLENERNAALQHHAEVTNGTFTPATFGRDRLAASSGFISADPQALAQQRLAAEIADRDHRVDDVFTQHLSSAKTRNGDLGHQAILNEAEAFSKTTSDKRIALGNGGGSGAPPRVLPAPGGADNPNDISRHTEAIKRATVEQNKLKNAIEVTKITSENFAQSAALAIKRFTAFLVPTTILFSGLYALKTATGDALKLEAIFTKIEQSLGSSSKNIGSVINSISAAATKTGTSASDIGTGVQLFAQAGFQDPKQLSGVAQQLSKIPLAATFGDINSVTDGLIATFGQFNKGLDDTADILDKVNQFAADFAVESKDIFDGIKRGGSAFSVAGGQLEDFIKLFTVLRSATRESADSLGVFFKTGVAQLLTPKSQGILGSLGVSKGNITSQLTQLSDVFASNKFSGFQKIGIAEELVGQRQFNRLLTLTKDLANPNIRSQLQRSSLLAPGSLDKSIGLRLDDIGNALQRVRENFNKFVRDIVLDDGVKKFVKDVADATIHIIDLGKELRVVLPILGALASALVIPFAAKSTVGFGRKLLGVAPNVSLGAGLGSLGKGLANNPAVAAGLLGFGSASLIRSIGGENTTAQAGASAIELATSAGLAATAVGGPFVGAITGATVGLTSFIHGLHEAEVQNNIKLITNARNVSTAGLTAGDAAFNEANIRLHTRRDGPGKEFNVDPFINAQQKIIDFVTKPESKTAKAFEEQTSKAEAGIRERLANKITTGEIKTKGDETSFLNDAVGDIFKSAVNRYYEDLEKQPENANDIAELEEDRKRTNDYLTAYYTKKLRTTGDIFKKDVGGGINETALFALQTAAAGFQNSIIRLANGLININRSFGTNIAITESVVTSAKGIVKPTITSADPLNVVRNNRGLLNTIGFNGSDVESVIGRESGIRGLSQNFNNVFRNPFDRASLNTALETLPKIGEDQGNRVTLRSFIDSSLRPSTNRPTKGADQDENFRDTNKITAQQLAALGDPAIELIDRIAKEAGSNFTEVLKALAEGTPEALKKLNISSDVLNGLSDAVKKYIELQALSTEKQNQLNEASAQTVARLNTLTLQINDLGNTIEKRNIARSVFRSQTPETTGLGFQAQILLEQASGISVNNPRNAAITAFRNRAALQARSTEEAFSGGVTPETAKELAAANKAVLDTENQLANATEKSAEKVNKFTEATDLLRQKFEKFTNDIAAFGGQKFGEPKDQAIGGIVAFKNLAKILNPIENREQGKVEQKRQVDRQLEVVKSANQAIKDEQLARRRDPTRDTRILSDLEINRKQEQLRLIDLRLRPPETFDKGLNVFTQDRKIIDENDRQRLLRENADEIKNIQDKRKFTKVRGTVTRQDTDEINRLKNDRENILKSPTIGQAFSKLGPSDNLALDKLLKQLGDIDLGGFSAKSILRDRDTSLAIPSLSAITGKSRDEIAKSIKEGFKKADDAAALETKAREEQRALVQTQQELAQLEKEFYRTQTELLTNLTLTLQGILKGQNTGAFGILDFSPVTKSLDDSKTSSDAVAASLSYNSAALNTLRTSIDALAAGGISVQHDLSVQPIQVAVSISTPDLLNSAGPIITKSILDKLIPALTNIFEGNPRAQSIVQSIK